MLIAAVNYYYNGLNAAASCLVMIAVAMLAFNLWRSSQIELWVLRGFEAQRADDDPSEVITTMHDKRYGDVSTTTAKPVNRRKGTNSTTDAVEILTEEDPLLPQRRRSSLLYAIRVKKP